MLVLYTSSKCVVLCGNNALIVLFRGKRHPCSNIPLLGDNVLLPQAITAFVIEQKIKKTSEE
jgi:hypothetical protein